MAGQTNSDTDYSQSTPQEIANDERVWQAYDRIQPRLQTVADSELAPTNTNMAEAALVATAVARRVTEPELYARFQAQAAAGELDMAHVDDLGDLAWGTLHAAIKADRLRYVLTRARLPEDLLARASAVEQRMQACCEYHLADHPTAGPEVERLRAGHGHRDLADDLYGYAALYRAHEALIARDIKHYRASDANEAFHLSREIYALLGDALVAKQRSASAELVRAWTLLLASYGEVSAVGRYLLRRDPATAATLFPSLVAAGRTARRRRGAPAGAEPSPPQDPPTAQPTEPAAPA